MIKPSFAGINSPALEPSPSLCFKLSWLHFFLNHIRVYRQSCTHIKAVLSICDKKVFRKKCKAFTPAGVAAAMTSQISFSFFYSGPYTRFIMKWWKTTAAGFNLWYTLNNSTFSCCHDFSLLLGNNSSIASGPLYRSHGVIQGLQ